VSVVGRQVLLISTVERNLNVFHTASVLGPIVPWQSCVANLELLRLRRGVADIFDGLLEAAIFGEEALNEALPMSKVILLRIWTLSELER
jgi:hypothetical protein